MDIYVLIIITSFSEKEAEDEKNTGNNFYKQKDYFKAIKFYTNAINLMPEKAAYYGNRAAAYMMISNFSSALDDSLKSVEKDPNFFKVGFEELTRALGRIPTHYVFWFKELVRTKQNMQVYPHSEIWIV